MMNEKLATSMFEKLDTIMLWSINQTEEQLDNPYLDNDKIAETKSMLVNLIEAYNDMQRYYINQAATLDLIEKELNQIEKKIG